MILTKMARSWWVSLGMIIITDIAWIKGLISLTSTSMLLGRTSGRNISVWIITVGFRSHIIYWVYRNQYRANVITSDCQAWSDMMTLRFSRAFWLLMWRFYIERLLVWLVCQKCQKNSLLKRCRGTDEPLDYEMREFWNWIPNVRIK